MCVEGAIRIPIRLCEDADLDRPDSFGDVSIILQIDLVEQIQIHPIEPLGNDHRIVQRCLGEPAPIIGLEGLSHGAAELLACPPEQRAPYLLQTRPTQRLRIGRVEPPPAGHPPYRAARGRTPRLRDSPRSWRSFR